MAVLIDIEAPEHHLFKDGDANRAQARLEQPNAMADGVTIGLINNMPDSALIPTERQVFDLLDAAADDIPVRLRFYGLPSVARSDWASQYIGKYYADIEGLWDGRIDGLIVTGAEPKAPELTEEPYWRAFTDIVDWAKDRTVSTVWSCLAVHGAVLHDDQIERRKLADKCIGIFDQKKMLDHPLLEGVPATLRIPHARWNEIDEDALTAKGYSVLTRSAEAGVDTFIKQQDQSLFVYFQGHPEYDAHSLLGEYRRDIGRFLRGESEGYPAMPRNYFDHQAEALLAAFKRRATAARDNGSAQGNDMFARFPVERVAITLTKPWQGAAVQIYRNWLSYIAARRAHDLRAA
jgi:homoserine O-succinyltransferase/O-acetyltransferase